MSSVLIQLVKNENNFVSEFRYNETVNQIRFKYGASAREANNFSNEMAKIWLPYIQEKHPEATIIKREKALEKYDR